LTTTLYVKNNSLFHFNKRKSQRSGLVYNVKGGAEERRTT